MTNKILAEPINNKESLIKETTINNIITPPMDNNIRESLINDTFKKSEINDTLKKPINDNLKKS